MSTIGGASHIEKLDEINRLRAVNTALLAAIKEISLGQGQYSADRLTHASDTIDDMNQLALDAVEAILRKQIGPVRGGWRDLAVDIVRAIRPSDLGQAALALADAADDVGVKFFDTDTMDPLVEKMQKATQALRRSLKQEGGG